MVTNQNHSSNISNEQKVIKYIKKLAQIFEINEQNTKVYSLLSRKIKVLEKKMDDYHFQYNNLKKLVKRLE